MRILLLVAFILFFYVAAQAQSVYVSGESKDTLKVSVSFANTDFTIEDIQGIQGELDAKILRSGRFRLGGVFHYVRPCFDCYPKVDTYSAGPQVSYDVFGGRISLFGRGLFGATVDYHSARAFTRTYGFGGDVNLGNVFVRPFLLDFQRIEGVPITVNRFGAGLGVKF